MPSCIDVCGDGHCAWGGVSPGENAVDCPQDCACGDGALSTVAGCEEGSCYFESALGDGDSAWGSCDEVFNCAELDYDGGDCCTPSCDGLECGADGCGGSCGDCEDGSLCNAEGLCKPVACVPSCGDSECGADGCGGLCGDCADGFECDETAQCVAVCGDGECQPGEVCDEDCVVSLPEHCEKIGAADDADTFLMCTQTLTWAEARAECQALGADLASIHSSAEQAVVEAAVIGQQAAWIGLNDLAVEGVFEWCDGTDVDYEHWWDVAPDDWLGKEDCGTVLVSDGLWNDHDCSGGRGAYVCRTPPPCGAANPCQP